MKKKTLTDFSEGVADVAIILHPMPLFPMLRPSSKIYTVNFIYKNEVRITTIW